MLGMSGELQGFHDLTSDIQTSMEDLSDEGLVDALADAGQLGEFAESEAQGRGWEFTRKITLDDGMVSVNVSVTSRGDDED